MTKATELRELATVTTVDGNGNVNIGQQTVTMTELNVSRSGTPVVTIQSTSGSSQDAKLVIRGSRTNDVGGDLCQIRFETNDDLANNDYLGFITAGKTEAATNKGVIRFGVAKTNGGTPSEAMRISSDHNIGMSEQDPRSALHITNNGDATLTLQDTSATGFSTATTKIDFVVGEYANAGGFIGSDANSRLAMMTNASYTSPLVLGTNGQVRLRISQDGTITIGGGANDGPDDQCALFVNGTDTSNYITNSSNLYDHNSDSFIFIKSVSDAITDNEAGIVLSTRTSGSGNWAIYAKRTGTYNSELIFRKRNSNGLGNTEIFKILDSGRAVFKTPGSDGNNASFGALQVNQSSDNDEDGIAILNSTSVRSFRMYVSGDNKCILNAGNGGGGVMLFNETGDVRIPGGARLGGEASENHLDHYEEGTSTGWWLFKEDDPNPSTSNRNLTNQTIYWVKVGRLVHVQGYIRTDGTPSGTGVLAIGGGSLPFAPVQDVGFPLTHTRTIDDFSGQGAFLIARAGSTNTFYLWNGRDVNDYTVSRNNISTNTQTNIVIQFSGTYYTSA